MESRLVVIRDSRLRGVDMREQKFQGVIEDRKALHKGTYGARTVLHFCYGGSYTKLHM